MPGASAPDGGLTLRVRPGDAEARLLTLLRPPVGMKDVAGADGVIRSVPDDSSGREVETCVVDVSRFDRPGKAHFFDMRCGTELEPSAGKVTVEMQAGDGRPIAVLPYAKPAILAESSVQDRVLSVEWRLESPGATSFAPHVVRVDMIDGRTGEVDRPLGMNAVTGARGRGAVRIPLAFEDEPRGLEVRLRDVLTGAAWETGGPGRARAAASAGEAAAPGTAGGEPSDAPGEAKPGATGISSGAIAAVATGAALVLVLAALIIKRPRGSHERRRRDGA